MSLRLEPFPHPHTPVRGGVHLTDQELILLHLTVSSNAFVRISVWGLQELSADVFFTLTQICP